jgi:hypothetical protein
MTRSNTDQNNDYELLLLATEQQVHAFTVKETLRISIGRNEANDVQLNSRAASNYHAEIMKEGEGLVLRDLGSTNGIKVNDETVHERRLQNDDRILIGNHVLTVHLKPADGSEARLLRPRRDPQSFSIGTYGNIVGSRVGSKKMLDTIRVHDPRDLTLADLLKILTTNGCSVVLKLNRKNEEARIFVSHDRIVHAEYGKARAEKALYRLFTWLDARYEISEYPTEPIEPTIDLPADTLIMEGIQQVDEVRKLLSQLPAIRVPLRLNEDCPLPLTAHTSAEIEIFKSLICVKTISAVLEDTPIPDVRVLRLVHSLIHKQVFDIGEASSSVPNETIHISTGH